MCLLPLFRLSTACDCVDLLPPWMLCGMQVAMFTSPSRTFIRCQQTTEGIKYKREDLEGREVQY